jgi:hypothetical protein
MAHRCAGSTVLKVYQAINAVQGALSVEGIGKTRKNTQGSGYMFRGIDEVYNALSPLLAKHGLVIIPRMIGRSCEERASKAGGALFYVTVEAEFDFVSAEDGSKHTARTFGEAMDSGDKATNKAMSAAYKYAAFQTFAIPTEGNPDADAETHEVQGRQQRGEAQPDMSPKARAERIKVGVAAGDAAGAAEVLASLPEAELNAIWALLDEKTADKLTAAWPKVPA